MQRRIAFLILLFALAGCGVSDTTSSTRQEPSTVPTHPPATPTQPRPSPPADDPLRQDAAAIAEDLGISTDEALRRLELQPAIAELNDTLTREQPDSFAGLWMEHQPAYRVVVAFARDGEATLAPYLAGSPLAPVVEVRSAGATLAELLAAQEQVEQLVDVLGVPFSSGINLPENRVEMFATDRPRFEQRLAAAGLSLPAHVVLVTTYEPLGPEPPFALTPVPAVMMPQLQVRSGAFMAALLEGTLIVEEDCLRVRPTGDGASYLVIWQPDYFLTDTEGALEILDRSGSVVARVGEPVRMGGGETSAGSAELNPQLVAPLAPGCGGPYWIMGELQ